MAQEAIAQALTIAKREGARAWFTSDDGYDFLLLGTLFGVSAGDALKDGHRVPDGEQQLHRLVDRLRAEYMDMPGLRLTPTQVQRLCGVERSVCQMVLDALVDDSFLGVNRDGAYGRLADGHHPRPTKAGLRITPTGLEKVS